MFEEYQVIRLKRDLPEHNLSAGVIGTILLVYDLKPNLPRAYEVEFVDSQGKTLAEITVFEEDMEGVKEL
jgi:Domain of unknown function (DUF4926)